MEIISHQEITHLQTVIQVIKSTKAQWADLSIKITLIQLAIKTTIIGIVF